MKVVLVTGCGSGLGHALATELVARGHTVYAGLRDIQTADGLDGAHLLQLDVTDPEQREAAVQRILDDCGRLDVLVNNAGIGIGAFLEQLDEDELRRVFEVNLFGVFGMTQAVLPTLRAQGAGTIVNVSSMSGRLAFPGLGSYASSKFALEGLSESWRHELGAMGIDLYLVQPGAYATDIWNRNRRLGRRAVDPESPWTPVSERVNTRFAALVDARKADPSHYARRVAQLIEGPRRRLRHPMGPGTAPRLFALRLLPFSVVEWAMRRLLMR